jgi:hypothetical protein
MVPTAGTESTKPPRAAAAYATLHSRDAQAPSVALSVAPADRPLRVPCHVAMIAGQVATAPEVSRPANTPPTKTPVVTANPAPPSTLSIASATAVATPSPIAPSPAVPQAPVPGVVGTTLLPTPDALAAPALVQVDQPPPIEARPPVPPPPPPSLVPAAATVIPTQVAEPSKAADPMPRDNLMAHQPDHATAAMNLRHKQAVADANADGLARASAQPAANQATHVSQDNALTHIVGRRHTRERSGDAMVARLNTLSLEAAQDGEIFIPPEVHRRSVIPSKRKLDLALP